MGKYAEIAREVLQEIRGKDSIHPGELILLKTHDTLIHDERVNQPYITKCGTLVIPFGSDPKYHWWKGGQSVMETLEELNAPPEVLVRYSPKHRN